MATDPPPPDPPSPEVSSPDGRPPDGPPLNAPSPERRSTDASPRDTAAADVESSPWLDRMSRWLRKMYPSGSYDSGPMPTTSLAGFLEWLVIGALNALLALRDALLRAASGAGLLVVGAARLWNGRSVRERRATWRLNRLRHRIGRDLRWADGRLAAVERRTRQAITTAQATATAVLGVAARQRAELTQWARDQGDTVVREARERAERQMTAARQTADTRVERVRQHRGDAAARTERRACDQLLDQLRHTADSVVARAERQRDAMVRTAQRAGDRVETSAKLHANAIMSDAVLRADAVLRGARAAHQELVDTSLGRHAAADRSARNYRDGLLPWADLTADTRDARQDQKRACTRFDQGMAAAEARLDQGGASLTDPPVRPVGARGREWPNADQLWAEAGEQNTPAGRQPPTRDNPRRNALSTGRSRRRSAKRARGAWPSLTASRARGRGRGRT